MPRQLTSPKVSDIIDADGGTGMRAWSCITLGEDRQYGGNTGYNDELERVYRFDSNVANNKRVAVGDFIVLRDREGALGTALITSLSGSPGAKLVRRCPVCQTTGIKRRKTIEPPWRCVRKHEFDVPVEASEPVQLYEAHLGDTFARIAQPVSAAALKTVALRPSDQLSIEELNIVELELLLSSDNRAPDSLQLALSGATTSKALDDSDAAKHLATMADQRERTLQSIWARRGQSMFRKRLLKRYGAVCQVTGCIIEELLEAAHIIPYLGEAYNEPSNGLLLRADIHTLFDLNLLSIEPDTYRLWIDPKARSGEYASLHRANLDVARARPSPTSLRVRWEAARLMPAEL